MKGRLVLVAAGLASLGCGGILIEVSTETMSEVSIELERDVPATDPNLGAALGIAEEAWFGAHEGHVGFWEAVFFTVAAEQARSDRAIGAGDLEDLRRAYDELGIPEISEERKDALRPVKAETDAAKRAELGMAPSSGARAAAPSGDLTGLADPAQLSATLVASGYPSPACTPLGPDAVGARCVTTKDLRTVIVTAQIFATHDAAVLASAKANGVVRSTGANLVDIEVLDGREAAKLYDALRPSGGWAADDDTSLRVRLGQLGWDAVCEGRVCEGDRPNGWVRVALGAPPDADRPPGVVHQDDRGVSVDLRVGDVDGAERVAATLGL